MNQMPHTIPQKIGTATVTVSMLFALALTVSGCCGPRESEPGAGMYVRSGYSKPVRVEFTQRWFAPGQPAKGLATSVTLFPGLERSLHARLDQSKFYGVEIRDKSSNRILLSAVIPQSVVREAQEGAVHLFATGDVADFSAGRDPDKEESERNVKRESSNFLQSLAVLGSLGYWGVFWHRRTRA